MSHVAKVKRELKKRVFRLMPKVICYICEEELNRQDATVDHYIPRKHKGSDRVGNYEMCCGPCNESKGGKMPNDEIKQQRMKNRLPDSVRYG